MRERWSEGPLREQNRVGECAGFSEETALTGCIVVLLEESGHGKGINCLPWL